jgi:hypothetical protein
MSSLTLTQGGGGSITFADGTTQATAASGAATDSYARSTANSAAIYANGAFAQANASFTVANNALANTNGVTTAGNLNVSNNLIVTNNVTASYFITSGSGGNISGVNTVFANTVNVSSNVIFSDGTVQTTSANSAGNYANGAFAQANASFAESNSAASYANSGFAVANSSASYANGAFIQANASFTVANNAFTSSNGVIAWSTANSAALYANGAFNQSNASFSVANSAATYANGAFVQANASFIVSNGAFIQANAAFTTANNALANTGSLITVNGVSQLLISNTTASVSNTTGALVINGGIGVAGNVYANGIYTNGLFYAANGNPISTGGGSGGGASTFGYLNNSIIFANTTGYLSNVSNLQFYSSNSTLVVTGNVVSNTATFSNLYQINIPLVVNDISNQFNGQKAVFPLRTDQTSISSIVDSKDVEVSINGFRLAPYVTELRFPWITPYDSYKGFRIKGSNIIIYNAPDIGDQAAVVIRNNSASVQKRKYPFSATTIALGD